MTENRYIKEIIKIFEKQDDRYIAHQLAKPLMSEMTKDKDFLFDIIRHNLTSPDFLLRKRNYSTMMMEITYTKHFHLVMNIFPALPNRETNISFQNIHHHGNMLLTTAAAFGPGYSSYLFKKKFEINNNTLETRMQIERYYHNELYNIEFVDAQVPHIVFYPSSISATYALWSNVEKRGTDSFKTLPIIKKFKKPLVSLANFMGLHKILGINRVEYFDFYIKNKKIYALKNKLHYEMGSNENFIQNILYFIQQTKFNDNSFIEKIATRKDLSKSTGIWLKKYLNNESITDSFEKFHLNVDKLNLTKEEIEETMKMT